MKQTTLSKLSDGQVFKISKKSSGIFYKLIGSIKGLYVYTSQNSELSYARKGSTVVYI